MQPLLVIKPEVPVEPLADLAGCFVVVQIQVFIFDTPPQAFHKDIVERPPAAIHTDPAAGGEQPTGKVEAGELRSLVGIEHRWRPNPQRPLQGQQAKREISAKKREVEKSS